MTQTTIPNATEAGERSHLQNVRRVVEAELERFTELVIRKNAEARQIKKYIHEHKTEMDHAEKVSTRNMADQATVMTEHGDKRRRSLERLARSPYFGRIDFRRHDSPLREPVYIGIHSFHDDQRDTHLVHDWRAPVSSMFYHHETGPAGFDAPEGRVDGDVVLKRQYKIENGELEFMLETEMNIHDDLLQRELSQSSDENMRNIVATIQRDQNAIIRDEDTEALIIQGAAGSGKTSIALHRIAYLLYRFKDTLRSEDILIISPNNVFAHYISRVLPELGEEMIRETTMEALASQLLGSKVRFQTFSEQVATLLRQDDEAFAGRIRFKSSTDFLEKLDEYARLLRLHNVRPHDLDVRGYRIPADWIAQQFQRCGAMPFAKQIVAVTEAVVEYMWERHQTRINGALRTAVRKELQPMLRYPDIHAAYAGFYEFLAEFDLLVRAKNGAYEYADVFPLIYLKMILEGIPPRREVKHLLVDEMQDYSAVQYRVLSRLFPCRKTVLGDAQQAVNPLSSTSAEIIAKLLQGSGCITMNKSYRSTVQITRLALRIKPNPDIIPIDRHGEEPEICGFSTAKAELGQIRDWIDSFHSSGHRSLGIICKTQRHADALFKKLQELPHEILLLTPQSSVFSSGVILATAHLVKGLEFDEVIIPHVSASQYHSEIDRQMLYVACTRAMHRLRLTHTGERSPLLS